MKNIIFEKGRTIGNLYYLRIEGGQGHGEKYLGGTYKFVGGYFNPTEMEGRRGQALEKWCEDNRIPYVEADTFEALVTKLESIKDR